MDAKLDRLDHPVNRDRMVRPERTEARDRMASLERVRFSKRL